VSRKPSKSKAAAGVNDTQTILRHWREAVPNDRLAHLVKDATRALLRALQMRLTEHAISLGHWTFLRVLWERDGITQRDLSQQVGVMEPTTFAAVKVMEQLGYVTRRRLADNKKNLYVFLTPAGRKLKNVLVPMAEDVNQVAARSISVADLTTTRRTLFAILENLAADEAAHARRVPSTREVSQRVAEIGDRRARK
jgi:DNA-binding MarR family transcriptional regulator